MRRWSRFLGVLTGVTLALTLVTTPVVSGQSAQIQAAIRALLAGNNIWTGTNTFQAITVTSCTGCGGGAVWGAITGTLSDQTDLQNALNAKASLLADVTFASVALGTGPFPAAGDLRSSATFTAAGQDADTNDYDWLRWIGKDSDFNDLPSLTLLANATALKLVDSDPLANDENAVRVVLDYAGSGDPDILIALDPDDGSPSIWDTSGSGKLGLESAPWDQVWANDLHGSLIGDVGGVSISASGAEVTLSAGGANVWTFGDGNTVVDLYAKTPASGDGKVFSINASNAADSGGNGGELQIFAGWAVDDGMATSANGGDIQLAVGQGVNGGTNGNLRFEDVNTLSINGTPGVTGTGTCVITAITKGIITGATCS